MSVLSEKYNMQSFNSELVVKTFTKNDLIDGNLILNDAFPGDVVVINNEGRVLYAEQSEYSENSISGVKINLSSYIVQGEWKVRYNKSSHVDATIKMDQNTIDNLILYSLIFS